MTAWRHDLHQHPELALQETRTSQVVQQTPARPSAWMRCTPASPAPAWSASSAAAAQAQAALAGPSACAPTWTPCPSRRRTGKPYASQTPGVMHACGHDGHTTMLLGAARYLAETRNFDGTVYVIFQPAEENLAGGEIMVKEGLFERFPMDQVYGLHNWPTLPAGTFGWRDGPSHGGRRQHRDRRDRQGHPRRPAPPGHRPRGGQRRHRQRPTEHRGPHGLPGGIRPW